MMWLYSLQWRESESEMIVVNAQQGNILLWLLLFKLLLFKLLFKLFKLLLWMCSWCYHDLLQFFDSQKT